MAAVAAVAAGAAEKAETLRRLKKESPNGILLRLSDEFESLNFPIFFLKVNLIR